jgi:PadR family transcriptional regulator, regulatory protein AphA
MWNVGGMAGRQLTSFEHVLLGLICSAPSSGYDLKQRFASTPIGVYEPSSGALYPALRRLEQQGLVRAQRQAQPDRSARQRRVYEPTEAGRAVHMAWLRVLAAPATVSRDLPMHLMRFVMMEHLLPRADVLAFLRSLADALAAFTADLEKYAAAADFSFSGRHPGIALDHGVDVHRASLRWAERAIAALSTVDAAGSLRLEVELHQE